MSAGLREAKKEKTRVAIAQKGIELFLERGFDDVSIADIAAAAEVAKMTVFNYFPAKEDIFFFLQERTVADLADVVRNRPTGELALDAIHRYVLREFESRTEWTGLHDGAERFGAAIRGSVALQNALRRRWDSAHGELTSVLAESRAADDVIVAVVAAQISATVHQLVLANTRRIAAGVPPTEAVAQATSDTNRAFELLDGGRTAAHIDGY